MAQPHRYDGRKEEFIKFTTNFCFSTEKTLFLLTASVLLIFPAPTQAVNCSTVTCYNGGTCNNFTASPPCICPLPYIAPYCISAADYCNTLQPDKNITELPVCLSNGNCTMTYTDPYFNCTCPDPYTGIRCSETYLTATTTTLIVDGGSSAGAIAGIVFGVLGGLGVGGAAAGYYIYRKSKKSPPSHEPDTLKRKA